MTAEPRLLFYVQHLLGIGHLVRAGRIAAALAGRFAVTLVVGGDLPAGLVPAGVALFRLPPVRAGDGGFSALVHPDGRAFGEADKAMRRDRLLALFADLRPDVLLIEAFPFGRRQMRFELLPLLDAAVAATPRPLVVSSIRDILQDSRPDRQDEACRIVERCFDAVLVHGDPDVVALPASFPAAHRLAGKLHYTGLVGPTLDAHAAAQLAPGEVFDVIVSAGGGAVGADLLRTAAASRRLSCLGDARWLVLTGPNGATSAIIAEAGVVVRNFVPDMPARLGRARLSISQAGYNTVADLAAARCRAVLVPFARGGETEQTRRADILAARGWAVAVPEAGLTPAVLADAVDRAVALPEPGPRLSLGGARRSAELVATLSGTRRA